MIQNISSVRHFAVEIDVKTAAVNVTRLGFINCISRCNLLKNMIFLSSLVPFVQFLFYPMHLLDCNRLFPGFTTIQYSTIICSFLPSLTFYGGFFSAEKFVVLSHCQYYLRLVYSLPCFK